MIISTKNMVISTRNKLRNDLKQQFWRGILLYAIIFSIITPCQSQPCVHPPCASCWDVNVCASCAVGYHLSGTYCYSCLPTVEYCASCVSVSTICAGCYSAFTMNGDGSLCSITSPIQHCQQYYNDGSCKNCFTPFTNNGMTCDIKIPIMYCEFYSDVDGSCSGCYAAFDASLDNLTCTIRDPIQYCQFYQNTGLCKSCYSAFNINAVDPICSIKAPIQHCVSYQNSGKCHECSMNNRVTNYGLEPNRDKCYNCAIVSDKCIQCTDAFTCSKCYSPYVVDKMGGCDSCEIGYSFIDQSYCITTQGCLDEQILNGKKVCLNCYKGYHFVFNDLNKTCTCQSGYQKIYEQNLAKCVSVCGNAITTYDQMCDDGNKVSNDGCNKICQKEPDFQCSLDTPSQCTLNLNIDNFQSNYAQKIQDQYNKCRFSFSIKPSHVTFQNVKWQNHLFTNLSSDYIIPKSTLYKYEKQSNQIILELEYIKDLQGVYIEAKLIIDGSSASPANSASVHSEKDISKIGTQYQRDFDVKSVNSKISGAKEFLILSSPPSRSLVLKITGVSEPIVLQPISSSQAYKISSFIYIIASIFILIQFYMGSYQHKMMGLETIQIFQLLYFMRVVLSEEEKLFFKSMNLLKYTAFGGYNNYSLFYSHIIQSSNLVGLINQFEQFKEFVMIGVSSYFSLNINIMLIVLGFLLIYYFVILVKKIWYRCRYISIRELEFKQMYTITKRKSQWIYDHLVFPSLMLFNMVCLFSTVFFLQSKIGSIANSSSTNLLSSSDEYQSEISQVQTINYPVHLLVLYLTFGAYCYEGFLSYQQYNYSKLTKAQKQRAPCSMVEKLQHDENDANRPNYKPGYVLAYLTYFLLLELIVLAKLFIQNSTKDHNQKSSQNQKSNQPFLLYFIIGLTVLYEIAIFVWKPYYQPVKIYNSILKYNYLVLTAFVSLLIIISKYQKLLLLNYYTAINYCLIIGLVAVLILGYIRIFVQYNFRQKLQRDPDILRKYVQDNQQSHQKNEIESKLKGEMLNSSENGIKLLKQHLLRKQISIRKQNMFKNNLFIFSQTNQIQFKQSRINQNNGKISSKLNFDQENIPIRYTNRQSSGVIKYEERLNNINNYKVYKKTSLMAKNQKNTSQKQQFQQPQLSLKDLKQKMRMKTITSNQMSQN